MKRLGLSSKTVEADEAPTTSGSLIPDVVEVKVEKEESGTTDETKVSEIWKDKPAESNEKSREEEFEEYFDNLFM